MQVKASHHAGSLLEPCVLSHPRAGPLLPGPEAAHLQATGLPHPGGLLAGQGKCVWYNTLFKMQHTLHGTTQFIRYNILYKVQHTSQGTKTLQGKTHFTR